MSNLDPSVVGTKSRSYDHEITQQEVRALRLSLLMTDGDEDEVPPTYPTRLRHGEFELFNRLGLPLPQVLHGEQTYEFIGQLRIGTRLRFETTLANVVQKKGRSAVLNFLMFETLYRDEQSGDELVRSKTSVIVREKIGAGS